MIASPFGLCDERVVAVIDAVIEAVQSGATVEFMPYDLHLAKGGIIDVQNELNKKTRLRLFEITAALADKYIPDADRPR